MTTLRTNVVKYLWVVTALVNGKRKVCRVEAETQAIAIHKAWKQCAAEAGPVFEFSLVDTEKISPEDDTI